MALRDKQTTTLTPEGIVFRFPPRLSFESHKRDAEVTILWKDNVHVISIVHEDLNLFGNTTHPGKDLWSRRVASSVHSPGRFSWKGAGRCGTLTP